MVAADNRHALVERRLPRFQQHHGYSRIQNVHGYPAAHGAGADPVDLACFGVPGQNGNPGDIALNKEYMLLGGRLRRLHQFGKQHAFTHQACRVIQFHRGLCTTLMQ